MDSILTTHETLRHLYLIMVISTRGRANVACVRKTDWVVIKERARERRTRVRRSMQKSYEKRRLKNSKAPFKMESFSAHWSIRDKINVAIEFPLSSSRTGAVLPMCAIYLPCHLLSYAFLSGVLLNGTSAVWIVFVGEKSLDKHPRNRGVFPWKTHAERMTAKIARFVDLEFWYNFGGKWLYIIKHSSPKNFELSIPFIAEIWRVEIGIIHEWRVRHFTRSTQDTLRLFTILT